MPQVPGAPAATNTVLSSNTSNHHAESIAQTQNKSTESSDSSIDEQKDSDEKEGKIHSKIFFTFTFYDNRFNYRCYSLQKWQQWSCNAQK